MNLSNESKAQVTTIMDEARIKLGQALGVPVSVLYTLRFNNIDPAHICQTVCKVCDLYFSDVVSGNTKKEFVVARKLIAWLCDSYCQLSETEIAKILHCDRTTIYKQVQYVNDMIETNDDLYLIPLRKAEEIILRKAKNEQ